MKMTKLTSGAAFAFAALSLFGSHASACNLAGGGGVKAAMLASPSVRAVLPKAATGGLAPKQAGSTDPAGVVGLWQVTYSAGGVVVDMAFEVFHSDGTEMINDITPPAEGNVCLGVWVQDTATTYKLTHPGWEFDQNGNLIGTEMFEATVTMTNADTFTGTYTLYYTDLKGDKGPVYTGTLTATRVLPQY